MFNFNYPKCILVSIFLCCLFMTSGLQNCPAQDAAASPTPENEEIKKLKDQIELLKLQSEKATLEKTINDTQFPKPTATPLAGDTTIDSGVKIETEMMAYRALSNAAGMVANDVDKRLQQECESGTMIKNYFVVNQCSRKKIAILNSQWLTGLRGYWAAKSQLDIMRKGYEQVFSPPAPPPVTRAAAYTIRNGLVADIIRNSAGKNVLTAEDFYKSRNDNGFKALDSSATKTAAVTSAVNSKFKAAASTTLSVFGTIGSIAGAAIDLLALLRTDTKITGLNYTVQESAFVSQVYRELNKDRSKTLFYPIEFSPNLNLNKPFVILKNIQDASEMRAKSEQLVVGIEETDKGIKDATAAKSTLEERQKVLPDEIAGIKSKMRDLEKGFPNAAKRPRDVIIDLSDLEAKLKALMKESSEISGKLKKNAAAITELEKKRDEFYNEINPAPSADKVVKGFVDLSYDIDAVSTRLLNRNFTFEEVEGLSLNLESVKKSLADEAKKRLNLKRELTDEEKKELFNPIDAERLKIFVKVGREMLARQIGLDELEPSDFLTNTEQLKLLYPTNEQAGVDGKISDRAKAAALTKLKLLNKQFDKFFEDAVKVDEKLGVSPIALYLQSESLMDALDCKLSTGRCDDAFILALRVIDAGGNNRTKKNLLTMAVTGDNVSHSGGAIVEYKLYDMTGVIKTSSICRAYESYRKPGNINKPDKKGDNQKADCEAQPMYSTGGN